jgi:hypothetical protein
LHNRNIIVSFPHRAGLARKPAALSTIAAPATVEAHVQSFGHPVQGHCRILVQPPGHLELLPIAFATLREFRGGPPPPLSVICQFLCSLSYSTSKSHIFARIFV